MNSTELALLKIFIDIKCSIFDENVYFPRDIDIFLK